MKQILSNIYDNRLSDSWASNLRKKRLNFFKSLTLSLPTPLKILDVGGRPKFWEKSGFFDQGVSDVTITLINIEKGVKQIAHPKLKGIVGDARNMQQFKDKEFDVVFSNSVIEHVGNYEAQQQMADEVRRVGKRYFLQTPNLFFPIEPHFVFPFFQFMPIELRTWLISHYALGYRNKPVKDKQKAREIVSSIRLLSKKELIELFPDATLCEEKFWGLTKSFTVYSGW